MTQSNYIANFSVQIGLFSVPCEVVAARTTEKGLRNVCPDCFQPLKQKLACENHGEIAYDKMVKAKEVAGQGLVPIPATELAAAKSTTPKWLLDLAVAKRDELLTTTQPYGSMYRLRPAKSAPAGSYALLREVLRNHPDLALYGMAKLQANFEPKPFMLSLWQDQVIMQELVPLQDMAPADELGTLTADPKYLTMLEQLVSAVAAPVDPNVFLNKRREAIEAFVAAHQDSAVSVDGNAPTAPVTDILAALNASLQAVQATRPTRTRKTKKDNLAQAS